MRLAAAPNMAHNHANLANRNEQIGQQVNPRIPAGSESCKELKTVKIGENSLTKVMNSSCGSGHISGYQGGKAAGNYSSGNSHAVQTPLPPLVPAPVKTDWRDVLIGQGNLPFDYKTQWCEHFLWTGWCPANARCHCAHSVEERRVEAAVKCGMVSPHFKTRMCRKMFWSGWCPHGPFHCTFAHRPEELRVEAAVSSGHLPLEFCTQKCPHSFCAVAACPQVGCTHAHFQEELREYRRYAIPGVTYSTAPPPSSLSQNHARGYKPIQSYSPPVPESRNPIASNMLPIPTRPVNHVKSCSPDLTPRTLTPEQESDLAASFLPDDLYDDTSVLPEQQIHDSHSQAVGPHVSSSTNNSLASFLPITSIAPQRLEAKSVHDHLKVHNEFIPHPSLPTNDFNAPHMFSEQNKNASTSLSNLTPLNGDKGTFAWPKHASNPALQQMSVQISQLWKTSEAKFQNNPTDAASRISSVSSGFVASESKCPVDVDETIASQGLMTECENNIDRTLSALLDDSPVKPNMPNSRSKSEDVPVRVSAFTLQPACMNQQSQSLKPCFDLKSTSNVNCATPPSANWQFNHSAMLPAVAFPSSTCAGGSMTAFCAQGASLNMPELVRSSSRLYDCGEGSQPSEITSTSSKEGLNDQALDEMLSQLMV